MLGNSGLERQVVDQERRRNQLERIAELGVALTEATGTMTVAGVGEMSREVGFTVFFLERPALSIGWEIADEAVPTPGNWPVVSAGIFRWLRKDMGAGRKYYSGAQIGVVVQASADQKITVHWSVRGKAFRNPVESSDEI